jgi:hypothetical protein
VRTIRPAFPAALNLAHPAFAKKSIFNAYIPGLQTFDGKNQQFGAATGDVFNSTGGLKTASGIYLTGNAARPKFTGSTISIATDIVIGTNSTGADVTTHPLGTAGDQFLKFELRTVVFPSTSLITHAYIAGSYRNSNGAAIGRQLAVGDRVFLCTYFNQPNWVAGISINGSAITWSSDAAYGAPLDDRGGGLLFGKNDAGTMPFDGITNYSLITEVLLSRTQLDSIRIAPWSLFASPRRIWSMFGASAGATDSGVGTSDGVATASAVGASLAASAASAAGVATAAAVGASVVTGVGAAAGVATADAVGSFSAAGASVGSSTGVATAAAVGASIATGVGSAAGLSSVSGVGSYIGPISAVGSSAGTSTASAVGSSTGLSIWTDVGTASSTWTDVGAASSIWTDI